MMADLERAQKNETEQREKDIDTIGVECCTSGCDKCLSQTKNAVASWLSRVFDDFTDDVVYVGSIQR